MLQRRARGLLRGRTPAEHRERVEAARERDYVTAGGDGVLQEQSGEQSSGDDGETDASIGFACTAEGCVTAYLDGQVRLVAAAIREVARLLSEVEDWE